MNNNSHDVGNDDNVFSPQTQEELSQWIIQNNSSKKLSLFSVGNRNPEQVLLKLSELNQLVDYPAKDMTVTVETGITVAALQAHLEEHQQWLPLKVPCPETMTLAEVICQNWFGSLASGYGTMRDWLLGVTAVDGQGRVFHAGGRVVKNVAGYDLCKLLVGSEGKLAIPVQVTLQVKPVPERILAHQIQTSSTAELQELWLDLRNLPVKPAIFDARISDRNQEITPKDRLKSACPVELCYAIAGSEQTTKILSDTIKQTVSRYQNAKTKQKSNRNNSCDVWEECRLLSDCQTIYKVGTLPSKSIELLEIAERHHCFGFVVTTTGAGFLTRGESDDTGNAEEENNLRKELEQINASVQTVANQKIDHNSASEVEHRLPGTEGILDQKLKQEFDPMQLFD